VTQNSDTIELSGQDFNDRDLVGIAPGPTARRRISVWARGARSVLLTPIVSAGRRRWRLFNGCNKKDPEVKMTNDRTEHLKVMIERVISPVGVVALLLPGLLVYHLPNIITLPASVRDVVSGIGAIFILAALVNSSLVLIVTDPNQYKIEKVVIAVVQLLCVAITIISVLKSD
jgi:hypothetical protein